MLSHAQTRNSTRLGIWLTFAFFITFTALAMVYCPFALWLIALLSVIVIYKPDLLMPLVITTLVWIPLRGIFSHRQGEVSAAVLALNIETGDLPRQIAIIALLAIGCWILIRNRLTITQISAVRYFSAYMALGMLSILWSADPLLTARRVTAAIGCTAFAVGMAAGYYGQQHDGGLRFVRHVCIAGSFACAGVIAVAVLYGNFHLFDLGWRLGSVGRENQISWVAALPFLAAYVTRSNRTIWPQPQVVMSILGLTLTVLLLSKSRTTIIAAGAGLTASELLGGSLKRRVTAAMLIGTTLAVIVSSTLFAQLWKRGADEDQLHTASGRTALWEVVWRDISMHPFLGFGYGAYWTADRVTLEEVQWAATSAHCGYLDMAAELGFTGLGIIVLFIVMSCKDAWRLMSTSSRNHDIARLFLVIMVSFVVINMTESYINSIEYFPVLATLTFAFYISFLYRTIHAR